jgi:hypothetical protein
MSGRDPRAVEAPRAVPGGAGPDRISLPRPPDAIAAPLRAERPGGSLRGSHPPTPRPAG